ncbi:MAG: hypothetical protein K2W97_05990 [Chthoniobacterales bacterium]|nr:hypothetical protein [Chthoniobacterales bacterium]
MKNILSALTQQLNFLHPITLLQQVATIFDEGVVTIKKSAETQAQKKSIAEV